MKSVDVKSRRYVDFNLENNDKYTLNLKFIIM